MASFSRFREKLRISGRIWENSETVLAGKRRILPKIHVSEIPKSELCKILYVPLRPLFQHVQSFVPTRFAPFVCNFVFNISSNHRCHPVANKKTPRFYSRCLQSWVGTVVHTRWNGPRIVTHALFPRRFHFVQARVHAARS